VKKKEGEKYIIERDWNVRLVSLFSLSQKKFFVCERSFVVVVCNHIAKKPLKERKKSQDCVIKVLASHDVRIDADLPLPSAVLGQRSAATE
jgi:hypothetical protein